MCEDCKELQKKLTNNSPVKWYITLAVTILIFIISQVFMYGKIIGQIENHIENDPTHRELVEEFVTKDEFNTIKDMVKYLYEKQGGK